MAIALTEKKGGKILEMAVSGKLADADYERCVPEFDRLAKLHGKIRVLFEMNQFHGWDAKAAWDDIKFAVKHYRDIERLAVVGEKKWQQGWLSSASLSPRHRFVTSTKPKRKRLACGSSRAEVDSKAHQAKDQTIQTRPGLYDQWTAFLADSAFRFLRGHCRPLPASLNTRRQDNRP